MVHSVPRAKCAGKMLAVGLVQLERGNSFGIPTAFVYRHFVGISLYLTRAQQLWRYSPKFTEANRIDAAFVRFDYSGSGTLDESEVAAMLLGPHGSSRGLSGDVSHGGARPVDVSRFQFLGFPDPAEESKFLKLRLGYPGAFGPWLSIIGRQRHGVRTKESKPL
eukprot:Skav207250  [mRNA]  locus=scaffold2560:23212:23703:+ [translate_table: standard]